MNEYFTFTFALSALTPPQRTNVNHSLHIFFFFWILCIKYFWYVTHLCAFFCSCSFFFQHSRLTFLNWQRVFVCVCLYVHGFELWNLFKSHEQRLGYPSITFTLLCSNNLHVFAIRIFSYWRRWCVRNYILSWILLLLLLVILLFNK